MYLQGGGGVGPLETSPHAVACLQPFRAKVFEGVFFSIPLAVLSVDRSLDGVRVFLIDIDGVVKRGNALLPGAREAVSMIRRRGAKVFFVTNNSARSRASLIHELGDCGIVVERDKVLTSSYCAATYLRSLDVGTVYVVGEAGLKDELKSAGLNLIDESSLDCDAVVVGIDRDFTYRKMDAARRFVVSGTVYVATNTDATFPTENGERPGAGAVVAGISVSSGREPVIVGKPNDMMMRLALQTAKCSAKECAAVGDRPETDVAMARKGGCIAVLVLTGVASSPELEHYPPEFRPDVIFPSLAEVARNYRSESG